MPLWSAWRAASGSAAARSGLPGGASMAWLAVRASSGGSDAQPASTAATRILAKLRCKRFPVKTQRRIFRYSGAMISSRGALRLMMSVIAFLGTTLTPAADTNWHEHAAQTLAVLRGSEKVAGLHNSVRVQRDRWGVAHIYARDQHDLFFAQGFVAAQDRLFQMELWKRAGQGRLAEILGASAVQRDINARRLRYRGDLQQEYGSYSPDTREILEAFTAGINAYMASRADHPPLEFEVAGFRPEPWKPEDCLNRMAAFSMTSNSFEELQH